MATGCVDKVLVDLIKKEVETTKKLFIVLYLVIGLLLTSLIANALLLYGISQYQVVETTVEETYDYQVEGNENTLINGNQYNDSSTHNENGGAK